jgi:membrane protease YdiL (CAAX protease family)
VTEPDAAAPSGAPGTGGWITGPEGRIRWGWRILLFLSLFFAFAAVIGPVAIGLVGRPGTDAGRIGRGLTVSVPSVLLASWVMMSVVESRSLAALGLVSVRFVPDSLLGLGIGALLIGSVLALLALTGSLEWTMEVGARSWGLRGIGRISLILGLAAFFEEVLFRGYPFQVLAEVAGPVAAVGLTSAVFGAAHLPNPGVGALAVANTILAGILLGIVYWRTFSIWLVTGVHFAWNGVMSLAADLPVSGLELGSPGFQTHVMGPEIWTGGEYGPEGGLALTLVTLAAIAWSARSHRLNRAPAVLALHPLPRKRVT